LDTTKQPKLKLIIMKTQIKFFKAVILCAMFAFVASCENEEPETLELTSEEVSLSKTYNVKNEKALVDAVKKAKAGDVIKVSGTIKLKKTLKLKNKGNKKKKITLTGGTLDCSRMSKGSRGVDLRGSYWDITKMTIKNAPDNGIVVQYGGYNWIYKVTTKNNGDTGIQIYNKAHHNYVEQCYSKDNYDKNNGGENADGFACKLSGGKGNVFDKCVADHNSDDGWDLYGQPYTVVIKNCTAKNNGYGKNGDGNGFKLGSKGQKVKHTVTKNKATKNKAYGYDGNGNKGKMNMSGSGGSGNKKGLFNRIYK